MTDGIIVRLIDMPLCIKAVTIPSEDGAFNVYVNARYSHEEQDMAIKHEINHIYNNDFCNSLSIVEVENLAEIL